MSSLTSVLLISCGEDATATIDAPTGLIDAAATDGPVATVDSSVVPADAAMVACTPQSGTNVTRQLVGTFQNPVLVTAPAGDPRLFVVERRGQIRIVKNGKTLPTPFLNIQAQVDSTSFNELGLLGLAFHPDYASNGRFFVFYTMQAGSYPIRVSEYHATPGSDVAETTETPLFNLNNPNVNHNGGMIAFGPDGYLYIGIGDGGGQDDPGNNGQNTNTLLGTILRIDVDTGEAAPTNPFVGVAGADQIWAYGLRNPWRFSFDRQTGDLYIGDVGQDAREEVNVQAASSTGGENYGWDVCEGTLGSCGDGQTAPVVTKSHGGDGWCSVIGGYVYRGSCMPDLQGWYFYGDYCANQIWRFQYSGGSISNDTNISSQLQISSLSSFGEDGFGELYIVSHSGPVYKIVHAP